MALVEGLLVRLFADDIPDGNQLLRDHRVL